MTEKEKESINKLKTLLKTKTASKEYFWEMLEILVDHHNLRHCANMAEVRLTTKALLIGECIYEPINQF